VPGLLNEKKSFGVLSQHVGLRPSRKGGIRMEAGKLMAEGQDVDVVHCYGHGGGGSAITIRLLPSCEVHKMVN
jgi:hypothetical protein